MRAHAAPTAALSRVLQLYNGGARSAHSRLVIGTAALQRRHTQRPQPPCQGHCSSTTAAHAAPTAALSRVLQFYNSGTRSAHSRLVIGTAALQRGNMQRPLPPCQGYCSSTTAAHAVQHPHPRSGPQASRLLEPARRHPVPGPQTPGPGPADTPSQARRFSVPARTLPNLKASDSYGWAAGIPVVRAGPLGPGGADTRARARPGQPCEWEPEDPAGGAPPAPEDGLAQRPRRRSTDG